MSRLNGFFVSIFNKKIGEDEFGNSYYESKKMNYLDQKSRYVVYNGAIEPSKVPPLWHSWLHHLSDQIPLSAKPTRLQWQQQHMPNVTGTRFSYDPCPTGTRSKVSADYKPWQPN